MDQEINRQGVGDQYVTNDQFRTTSTRVVAIMCNGIVPILVFIACLCTGGLAPKSNAAKEDNEQKANNDV